FQWPPLEHDPMLLFDNIQSPSKHILTQAEDLPDLSRDIQEQSIILINGNFNYHFDIQALLTEIKPKLSRSSRLVVVVYNFYLKWLYLLSNRLKLRKGPVPSTFLTYANLENLAKLSGYQIVKEKPCVFFPFKLFGLGDLINYILPAIPILHYFSLVSIITFRPVIKSRPSTLSIIIPAKNEEGNLENAMATIPEIKDVSLEIIFVEGNSTDGTWGKIQHLQETYKGPCNIRAFRQESRGKCDAVRLGFSHAESELLIILDADLTIPATYIARFYDAYAQGEADFINGNRLVYPMEGNAMQFLNRLGNIFFAKALSHILDIRLGDSLCGTKLFSRLDYMRMVQWRRDFGDFDPFGDFELLYPASILGLGTIDIPIRYLSRKYGSTNISRFRDGWMLMKMTLTGFFRIKTGTFK
ncbi:MAG: glycosyltransferase family 2 protein, partial [Chlamydiota bacterium]|nr:glycosyltransferase family 2 protein [Chlamydiota bacterium]